MECKASPSLMIKPHHTLSLVNVKFQCKLNCKIITQADIVFKNWVQENKRGCTWEGVVLLVQQQEAEKIPFIALSPNSC